MQGTKLDRLNGKSLRTCLVNVNKCFFPPIYWKRCRIHMMSQNVKWLCKADIEFELIWWRELNQKSTLISSSRGLHSLKFYNWLTDEVIGSDEEAAYEEEGRRCAIVKLEERWVNVCFCSSVPGLKRDNRKGTESKINPNIGQRLIVLQAS